MEAAALVNTMVLPVPATSVPWQVQALVAPVMVSMVVFAEALSTPPDLMSMDVIILPSGKLPSGRALSGKTG